MDKHIEVMARGIYRTNVKVDAWDEETEATRTAYKTKARQVLAYLDENGLQLQKRYERPKKKVVVEVKDTQTTIEEEDGKDDD